MSKEVARADVDRADRTIAVGANTVLTNNKRTAYEGAVTQSGNAIVQGNKLVLVENKPIARLGDMTSKNVPIQTGSPNVFADEITSGIQDMVQSDDSNDGTTTGREIAKVTITRLVETKAITAREGQELIDYLKQNPPPGPATSTVVVIMFRGMNPESTSFGVDNTAKRINTIAGYRAVVFNHEDWRNSLSSVGEKDTIVLYGFSKGAESVQNVIESNPDKRFSLVFTIDPWWTVTMRWGTGVGIKGRKITGDNVGQVFNWYSDKWKETQQNLPNGPRTNPKVTQSFNRTSHTAMPDALLGQIVGIITGNAKPILPREVAIGGQPIIEGKQGTFQQSVKTFNFDQKISKHFTLGELVNGRRGTRMLFPEQLQDHGAWKADAIVQNLSLLAQNILDPMYEKWPDTYWNSTQRVYKVDPKTGRVNTYSQHPAGMAADIQFRDNRAGTQAERMRWCLENLPFDQLILEGAPGRNICWLHISFVGNNIGRTTPGDTRKGNRPANDPCKYGTLIFGVADFWRVLRPELFK